jgi:hypothetical protein
VGFTEAAIVHERKALTLRVLELDRRAAVAELHASVGDPGVGQPLRPPLEALLAADAKRGARNCIGAATLRSRRPVEERQVAARRANPVCVEQVIGGDVVLIDGLLHQPQAQLAGIEIDVALGVCRDGRQMMDASELHGACPFAFEPGRI